ncbi:hypothetical protein DL95DRAFT_384299, partial [Leptodontidium sp. 2 PMI_412]
MFQKCGVVCSRLLQVFWKYHVASMLDGCAVKCQDETPPELLFHPASIRFFSNLVERTKNFNIHL